jgi:murein L,D-transpeptidase YcbB/YkuD
VNKDGSVHFRGDIYGRDRALGEALARSYRGSV